MYINTNIKVFFADDETGEDVCRTIRLDHTGRYFYTYKGAECPLDDSVVERFRRHY